ncbi:MAG: hypothetical protein JRF21_04625 [Deltaproteobacteria bacterium]|nr:hypothetical protein [Deltaproteobacteria bacterium]
MNIMPNHPEIIEELIEQAESDRLLHFNFSEFMQGPPLDEIYEKIDKTMTIVFPGGRRGQKILVGQEQGTSQAY